MSLPHPAITKIPNTEPAAVPDLWNATYLEIDANFTDMDGRVTAIESAMVENLADLGITVDADKINYLSTVSSNVQTQLNGKFATPAGTALEYVRGNGTLATFPTTWAWGSISGKPTTFAASGMSLAAGDVPALNQNTTGSAAKLTTPRTLTLGATGKNFDGSANIAWTLTEIGAAPTSHSHVIGDVTGLQTALDAKAGGAHSHTLDELSNVTVTNNSVGAIIRWAGASWVNATLAEAGIAAAAHAHAIANITGLQTALDGKLATAGTAAAATKLATARTLAIGSTTRSFDGTGNLSWTLGDIGAAAVAHSHVIGDVTGLQTALDGKATSAHNHTLDALSNVTITNKAVGEVLNWSGTAWINRTLAEAGIAAAAHTHTVANVTGLQAALDGKAGTGANNFSGVQTATGFTVSSSRALKQDIRALDAHPNLIDLFQPVTFCYKAAPEREVAGLIREEVAEIFPLACTEEGIDYGQLVPLLIGELQALRVRVSELEVRGG